MMCRRLRFLFDLHGMLLIVVGSCSSSSAAEVIRKVCARPYR